MHCNIARAILALYDSSAQRLGEALTRPLDSSTRILEESVDDLLRELRRFDAMRDGDELLEEVLERIPPAYAAPDILDDLSPAIAERLRARGVTRLYQHQADAVANAGAGAHVVLQAPTASGKTLAFQIPIMERLAADGGHALLIYPTKALGNDQRDQLHRMFEGLTDARGKRIESWWYDGDTDEEMRRAIRTRPPHILITTPEMLHRSFLGNSHLWTDFLKRLRFVVIDEVHEYRGYFGSNMSLLLRRFLASPGFNGCPRAVLPRVCNVRQRAGACRASDGAPIRRGERLRAVPPEPQLLLCEARHPGLSVLGAFSSCAL